MATQYNLKHQAPATMSPKMEKQKRPALFHYTVPAGLKLQTLTQIPWPKNIAQPFAALQEP